jgi:hypothetical protein
MGVTSSWFSLKVELFRIPEVIYLIPNITTPMKYIITFLFTMMLSISAFPQSFEDLDQMNKYEGFFDFYYNENEDCIYLVVEELDRDFLYVHSLSSGVGHNDLGLDRGQVGGQAVVHFRRAGNKILMVQPNLDFRAETTNTLEKAAVEQAFAKSVLHGFEIKDIQKGKYLIDLSELLYSDAHGVSERLSGSKQGNYTVDKGRSAMELSRTKAFPQNVEFEALLTFSGKPEGRQISSVTPNAHHISVVQHHSFVQLPDDNYVPREFHPQSGCIPISYSDYAVPVYDPIRKRVIMRHRLVKKDPGQAISVPLEPIIYYLDNGTPEPVRSALLEGGSWWSEAFEEIGFKDAYRVEMLPEGADPLDVRYNMIQWIHRSTRGWSYGSAVVDPRTGEIIKGHVSLGSLRIRQDFMIAQALLNRPYATDNDNHQEMLDLALARIRQLSAHEIGHTLGFTHNFAASTNNRSSVMDYPHPMVKLVDGEVNMDDAYDEGIADWDKVTVAYAYAEFEKDEAQNLQKILTGASERGLRFISDSDARAPGGAHPYAHLWDNGTSAIEELNNTLEVRHTAMKNFSVDNIRQGEPYATLEDIFVPLYFFHRYQVEATTKVIGGVEYQYSVKGDANHGIKPVTPETQRDALEAVIHTLSPEVLMIPEEKLELFQPRPPGYGRTRESFDGQTGVTFDYFAAPAVAANLTLGFLLHPERANRLVQQHALDNNLPGLEEVTRTLVEKTVMTLNNETGYEPEIRHSVNFIVIDHLIRLAGDPYSSPQVKAIVVRELNELNTWLEEKQVTGLSETYKLAYMEQIKQNKVKHLPNLPVLPPGAPIGMECLDH